MQVPMRWSNGILLFILHCSSYYLSWRATRATQIEHGVPAAGGGRTGPRCQNYWKENDIWGGIPFVNRFCLINRFLLIFQARILLQQLRWCQRTWGRFDYHAVSLLKLAQPCWFNTPTNKWKPLWKIWRLAHSWIAAIPKCWQWFYQNSRPLWKQKD